jgi:hypothetical protein
MENSRVETTKIRFYCEFCEEHRPIEIEPLRKDDLNGNVAWGDILCKECHFVIATVTSEVEGVLKLILMDGE